MHEHEDCDMIKKITLVTQAGFESYSIGSTLNGVLIHRKSG